jgi:hypothetical protein
MDLVITSKFINELEKYRQLSMKDDNDNAILKTIKIKNLILSNSFSIVLDNSLDKLISTFNNCNQQGNSFIINSLEEFIIKKQIKDNRTIKEEYTMDDSKSIIFKNDDFNIPIDESIITLNSSLNIWDLNLTRISNELFTQDYNSLSNVLPKCNCLFYIDPYISNGNFRNLKSFSKLLDCFLSKSKNPSDFHITILSLLGKEERRKGDGIKIVDSKGEAKIKPVTSEQINRLLEVLEKSKVKYQVYLVKKTPNNNAPDDRYFYTNYFTGHFGHPDRNTRYGINSMAILESSNEIEKSYKSFKRELESWDFCLNNLPENIIINDSITLKTYYGNNSRNRIFDNL